MAPEAYRLSPSPDSTHTAEAERITATTTEIVSLDIIPSATPEYRGLLVSTTPPSIQLERGPLRRFQKLMVRLLIMAYLVYSIRSLTPSKFSGRGVSQTSSRLTLNLTNDLG
jgi:hypothetical protein